MWHLVRLYAVRHSFSNFTHTHRQYNGLAEEKYKVKSKGVNIKGKYGIPNLSNLSNISHENKILSVRGV